MILLSLADIVFTQKYIQEYQKYLLIVIAIIIVLSLIVFIFLYFKTKRKIPEIKIGEKRKNNEENMEKTAIKCIKDLKKLKNNFSKLNVEEVWNKFSAIVNHFFKEFLELNYEFTYDELIRELIERKKDSHLILFVKKLQAKYSENSSKAELMKIISEFNIILKNMLKEKEEEIISNTIAEKSENKLIAKLQKYLYTHKKNINNVKPKKLSYKEIALINYIKKALELGLTKKYIRHKLLEKNWPKNIVDGILEKSFEFAY